MTKLTKPIYLTISPIRVQWDKTRIRGISLVKTTTTKPSTGKDQIAIKLNLSIDSAIFDEILPSVNIEISEAFVNAEVDVTNEPEATQ